MVEDLIVKAMREDFWMYESGAVVIFATKTSLELLSKKQTWFGDGTFDSAPLGKQIYTTHAIISGNKTFLLFIV